MHLWIEMATWLFYCATPEEVILFPEHVNEKFFSEKVVPEVSEPALLSKR